MLEMMPRGEIPKPELLKMKTTKNSLKKIQMNYKQEGMKVQENNKVFDLNNIN